MNEWKDIKDAPRDGTEILAYIECENFDGYDVIRRAKTLTIPWIGVFDYEDANIKGWMPLPKPPKLKKCVHDNYEVTHMGDDFIMMTTRGAYTVKYCPICGQKAGE